MTETNEVPVEPVTDPDHEDAPGVNAPPVSNDTPDPVVPGPEGEDPEVFPREYVEELRKENGKYRQRAQLVDEFATRLHTALVTATGRLQDATDLSFDEAHLADPDALGSAIDELLNSKPHLANRKPSGDIGQGVTVDPDTFSLAGALRSNAS